jgi:hypothetical protein
MTGMRMKLWVCGLLLCLAACTVNMGANPTVPASETPEPTATITPIPTETATPSPSATSTTTLTPTLTATPRPVIHAGNAGFLGQVFQIPHPDSRSLVFAPDSTWLLIGSGNASSGNNLVSMWWPDQEQLINLAPAATTVWEAAFSPDGYEAAYVVDNPGQDLRGYVVDVGARREIAALKGTGTAYSLAYSPDGKRLALGGLGVYPNGVIWIYDTADWAVLQELPVNGQNVLDLVYSPDGSRLYSTGTDGGRKTPAQFSKRKAGQPDCALSGGILSGFDHLHDQRCLRVRQGRRDDLESGGRKNTENIHRYRPQHRLLPRRFVIRHGGRFSRSRRPAPLHRHLEPGRGGGKHGGLPRVLARRPAAGLGG